MLQNQVKSRNRGAYAIILLRTLLGNCSMLFHLEIILIKRLKYVYVVELQNS